MKTKGIQLIVLLVLIGTLLVGCGIQGQADVDEDKDPQEQVKKTEVDEVEESEEVEEEIIPPTDLPPTEEPTPTFTPEPEDKQDLPDPTPVVIAGGEKEQMVAKVKADLASRLGISQDAISVVSAEAVTWNDSSLGCPIAGMMYTQVLTPGYQIILMANGAEYDYRTDLGYFNICNQ